MGVWEAIILGIVQGATEYLPVSSSGHLVLVPYVFGFDKAPFVFDILVQMGTLLGVLIYYWKDLISVTKDFLHGLKTGQPFATPGSRFAWFVAFATIPAVIIGLSFKDVFEETFASPAAAFSFLLLTAFLLTVGEVVGKRVRNTDDMKMKDAWVIGFAQALALFPGVSRSGSTIAAGMMLGLERESAARFSFVMSIPVMVGAGVLATKDLLEDPAALSQHGSAIIVGFFVSAFTGYIVIRWFLNFVQNKSLMWFAAYCAVVGVGGLIMTQVVDAPAESPAVEAAPDGAPAD